jgi:hypothetical protein
MEPLQQFMITKHGTPMGEYEWHIGGHSAEAYTHVVDTIILYRDNWFEWLEIIERVTA